MSRNQSELSVFLKRNLFLLTRTTQEDPRAALCSTLIVYPFMDFSDMATVTPDL